MYAIGFDGGNLALVCFTTSFAEYILTESSETYVLFMLLKRKYTWTKKEERKYRKKEKIKERRKN